MPPRRTTPSRREDATRVDRSPAALASEELEESSYHTGAEHPVGDERSVTDPGGLPRVFEETRIAQLPVRGEEPWDDAEDSEDEDATRAGPPIHLEVISGPDQGGSRKFRGVRMVIGRSAECEFKLSDDSVSRRHLELVLGDHGVLLRDLGSGNGTRVNGAKVSEKLLEDGDEISLGKTRIRFVDDLVALRRKQEQQEKAEAEAMAPPDVSAEPDREVPEEEVTGVVARPPRAKRERAGPGAAGRRRILLFAAAGAVVLFVLLGATVLLREPEPPPPDPAIALLAEEMQRARNAFREGRFEEALALVESALKRSPDADPTGLADAARKELATVRGFDEVRALLRAGDLDGARRHLAEVPLAPVSGEAARKQLEEELAMAMVQHARGQLDAALSAEDPATARTLLPQLPVEQQRALLPEIERLEAALAARAEVEERERTRKVVAHRRAADARRQSAVEDAFGQVARKFHAGEFQRAALECDRVADRHRGDSGIRARARELKRLIPQFGRALDEGTRKYTAGNLSGAAAPLQRARELYRQIGFEGALGSVLDEQLAASALAAARSALARDDLAGAADHYRKAQSLDATDERPARGLEVVYGKAEQLYLDGYMIRDRDPRGAKSRFQIVVDTLPKDSETWAKAKSQLERMR